MSANSDTSPKLVQQSPFISTPKPCPSFLIEPHESETWLNVPWEIAAELQRPLPDERLTDVRT